MGQRTFRLQHELHFLSNQDATSSHHATVREVQTQLDSGISHFGCKTSGSLRVPTAKKDKKKPRKFGQSGNMTPWKFLEQNCSVDQGHRGCQQLSGVFPGTQQRSNRLVCLKSACRFLDTRRFSVISCWIMISCGKMARQGVRHHETPVSPLPNLEEYPDGPFSKFKQHRNG